MSTDIRFEAPRQFTGSPGSSGSLGDTPTWAVVTGLVRDPVRALAAFDTLVGMKAAGTLDGIVVASWTGEYDRYPEVLAFLARNEILIAECPQPRLKLNGHVMHQSRAVNLGLDFVPDGAAVLKLRPDLAHLGSAESQRVAERRLGVPEDLPGCTRVFRRKPVVQGAFVASPFYISDIVLLADKADMRRIFNFDYAFEFIGTRISPEQFFFASAFRYASPLFDLFLRVNDGIEHNDAELTQRKTDGILQSSFFIEVLAAYHLALEASFEVGFDRLSPSDLDCQAGAMRDQTLRDLLLHAAPETGMHVSTATTIATTHRGSVFSALLSGAFKMDSIGEAYLAAVSRLRDGRSVLDDPGTLAEGLDTYLRAMKVVPHFRPNLPAHLWGHRYRCHFGHDDPVVLDGANTTERLEHEINVLRRKIDSLNQQLLQQGGEATP